MWSVSKGLARISKWSFTSLNFRPNISTFSGVNVAKWLCHWVLAHEAHPCELATGMCLLMPMWASQWGWSHSSCNNTLSENQLIWLNMKNLLEAFELKTVCFSQGKGSRRYWFWPTLWKACDHVWGSIPIHIEQVNSMHSSCVLFSTCTMLDWCSAYVKYMHTPIYALGCSWKQKRTEWWTPV